MNNLIHSAADILSGKNKVKTAAVPLMPIIPAKRQPLSKGPKAEDTVKPKPQKEEDPVKAERLAEQDRAKKMKKEAVQTG